MIIGPDFIWLHVPKCGGTAAERCLRQALGSNPEVHFDTIGPSEEVIWHQNIQARANYDPDFDPSGKRIIACIRRLPGWLLSRVHFEYIRPPIHPGPARDMQVPTRDMLVRGEFFEYSGYHHKADNMIRQYDNPSVDHWIRIEHLHEDLSAFFGFDVGEVPRINETRVDYIKNLDFWFTPDEIAQLYEHNPIWAAIERKAYGNTLADRA